jgi:hypothetical protein
MPGPAKPGPAMPGPAKPGAAMPGPTKPGAAQPGPVDPKLAALIARPVSVVEAEPDAAKKPKASPFDPAAAAAGTLAVQAGQPARQPERGRKPELFRQSAQKTAEKNLPPRVVRPGDIECPNCHQGNYPWRTFCRACGLELDQAKRQTERHGLWSWLWFTAAAPIHAHRQKVVAAGGRPGRKYRQSEGAQRRRLSDRRHRPKFQLPHWDHKRMKKILPILLIALILFMTFGPFKKGFRHYYENAKNWVTGLEPQFVQLYPVQTVASSFVPGNPAGNVDDGDTTTFWAANSRIPITVRVPTTKVVEQVGPGGGKHKVTVHSFFIKHTLSAPGVGSWVKLIYNTSLPIRAVSIIPGNQFPPSQFTKFGHPENVEVIFSSGAPVFFTVPNDPGFFQKTFFPPRNSNFVELKILSTYAILGPGGNPVVKGQYNAVTEFTAYEETGG